MRAATPHSSRFNDFGTLPTPDGRQTFTSKSRKTTAEIQFARTGRVWIAEYRFRFKCGGFPDSFQPHPSAFHARKQFGNSVAVPVVREIGRQLAAHLDQRT